jgi:hypothetical protein
MGLGVPWLSARLTNVLSSSELEGRTHNVTPVSYRTRALARVRLAPTGVRYACGQTHEGPIGRLCCSIGLSCDR